MEKVVLVNEDDEVIGEKERTNLTPDDTYRVSVLWITNSKGDILLAQRAFTKKKNPGVWAAAVAGTVEADEDYDSNIIKETQEEIGLVLSLADLKKGPKLRVNSGGSNHFSQSYFYSIDKDAEAFTIQRSEIEQLKWFSLDTLKKMVIESPAVFSVSSLKMLTLLLENK